MGSSQAIWNIWAGSLHNSSAVIRMSWGFFNLYYTFAQLAVLCAVAVAKACVSFGFTFPALSFLVRFCFPWQDFLEDYQSRLSSDHLFGSELAAKVPTDSVRFQSPGMQCVTSFSSSGTGSLTNAAFWKSERHHHAMRKQYWSRKIKQIREWFRLPNLFPFPNLDQAVNKHLPYDIFCHHKLLFWTDFVNINSLH